jgi:hypothetical protein
MGRALICRANDRADNRLGAAAKQRHEAHIVRVSNSPRLRGEADGKERGQGKRKGPGEDVGEPKNMVKIRQEQVK